MRRQHVRQRVRLERDDHRRRSAAGQPGRLHNPGIGDRAHLAQLLRQDQVRLQLAEQRLVQRIQPMPATDRCAHRGIDLVRPPHLLRQQVAGHPRHRRQRIGREVALVGDRHQSVLQAERADDLGGRRQQRHDPPGRPRQRTTPRPGLRRMRASRGHQPERRAASRCTGPGIPFSSTGPISVNATPSSPAASTTSRVTSTSPGRA